MEMRSNASTAVADSSMAPKDDAVNQPPSAWLAGSTHMARINIHTNDLQQYCCCRRLLVYIFSWKKEKEKVSPYINPCRQHSSRHTCNARTRLAKHMFAFLRRCGWRRPGTCWCTLRSSRSRGCTRGKTDACPGNPAPWGPRTGPDGRDVGVSRRIQHKVVSNNGIQIVERTGTAAAAWRTY